VKLPKPEEVKIPTHIKDHMKYMEGWQHGMTSNRLDIVPGHEDDPMYGFKESFRAGFREAKLWLRDNGYVGGTLPTKMVTK
jgi:hypothetical protein